MDACGQGEGQKRDFFCGRHKWMAPKLGSASNVVSTILLSCTLYKHDVTNNGTVDKTFYLKYHQPHFNNFKIDPCQNNVSNIKGT